MSHLIFTIIFSILLLPGLVAIPMMLPGVPYMFVIAILYGLVDGFVHLTTHEIYILGGIMLLTLIIDQLAGFIAAKWGGARGKTFIYGIAGVILGTIFLPLFGGLIGLFVGILVGELIRRHKEVSVNTLNQNNPTQLSGAHVKGSLKAATAGVLGSLTAIIIDLCLGVLFIGLFIWFVI